jgi:hypothetical protein
VALPYRSKAYHPVVITSMTILINKSRWRVTTIVQNRLVVKFAGLKASHRLRCAIYGVCRHTDNVDGH